MMPETGHAESTDQYYEVVDVRKISVRKRKICTFCGCLLSDPCHDTLETEFCERNPNSAMQVSPD